MVREKDQGNLIKMTTTREGKIKRQQNRWDLFHTYDYAGNRVKLANATTTTYYPNKYYNYDGTKKTKSIYAGDQLVGTIETVSTTVTPYYNHTE